VNTASNEPHPFRISALLLNAALVLPPAFLYTVKTDSPVYFLLASAILLFAFFRKDYLPLRDRPVIYSVTAALVLTILPDMLIVIDDSRYGIFDLLIRSNLIVPLMIYLAAFSCAFYPYPQRRGITAACVVLALVICGDRFNTRNLSNTLLFFLDPVLLHYPTAFALAAGWTALVLPIYFLLPGRPEKTAAEAWSARLRPVILIALLLVLPLGALAVQRYYYSNDRLMRAVEYYVLRISVRRFAAHYQQNRRRILSASTDLNRPLPPEWLEHADAVLLRVRAPFPPGYLRSGVYELYHSGQWRSRRDSPAPQNLPADRRAGLISYSTFTLPGRAKTVSGASMEIYFAGLQSEGRIPVPGDLLEIDAVADSGTISEHGLLTLKHWKADGGCTVRMVRSESESAWQGPAEPEKNPACLAVPAELQRELAAYLQGVLPPELRHGDAEVILRLKNHFADFRYSLENVNSGRTEDPLVYFLRHSRAGHCEFFATAGVLLLRSAGIPARYVTGFVCAEKSPVADYYLARSSHAHAWCEAYLRDRRQWVLVDFTPGAVQAAFRRPVDRNRAFRAWFDAVRQLFQQGFADIRRGHFAQAVADLFTGLWNLLWRLPPVGIGILILVLGAVCYYFRRRKKIRSRTGIPVLSPVRRRFAAEFQLFERRYAALSGERRPDETALLEFYREPGSRELCRFYETIRYGGTEPSEEDFTRFRNQAAEILAAARSRDKK